MMKDKRQEREELKRARARMRRTPAREQLREAREEWRREMMRREDEPCGYVLPPVPQYRGVDA